MAKKRKINAETQQVIEMERLLEKGKFFSMLWNDMQRYAASRGIVVGRQGCTRVVVTTSIGRHLLEEDQKK